MNIKGEKNSPVVINYLFVCKECFFNARNSKR